MQFAHSAAELTAHSFNTSRHRSHNGATIPHTLPPAILPTLCATRTIHRAARSQLQCVDGRCGGQWWHSHGTAASPTAAATSSQVGALIDEVVVIAIRRSYMVLRA